jgi:hypothetical protein
MASDEKRSGWPLCKEAFSAESDDTNKLWRTRPDLPKHRIFDFDGDVCKRSFRDLLRRPAGAISGAGVFGI